MNINVHCNSREEKMFMHNQQMLPIGKVAEILGITRRIIINYEAHGLIKADTRGEFNTGYRYYSMDTLVRIRTIRTYQNLGLSLDEIKGYLDDNTDLAPALERLEALREELDANISRLRKRMNKKQQSKILLTLLPKQPVYCRIESDCSIEARTRILRDVAYTAINRYGADLSHRMYFTQYSLDHPEQVAYCASVPKGATGEFVTEFPEAKALIAYHHGSYEGLSAVRRQLIDYAKENQIKLSGICRHIYLEGPPQHKNPESFITMVALLTEK